MSKIVTFGKIQLKNFRPCSPLPLKIHFNLVCYCRRRRHCQHQSVLIPPLLRRACMKREKEERKFIDIFLSLKLLIHVFLRAQTFRFSLLYCCCRSLTLPRIFWFVIFQFLRRIELELHSRVVYTVRKCAKYCKIYSQTFLQTERKCSQRLVAVEVKEKNKQETSLKPLFVLVLSAFKHSVNYPTTHLLHLLSEDVKVFSLEFVHFAEFLLFMDHLKLKSDVNSLLTKTVSRRQKIWLFIERFRHDKD